MSTSPDFEAIGYAAYATSDTAAPGANADVQEAIKGMPVGTGAIAIFQAFSRGWTKAADEAAAAVLAEPDYSYLDDPAERDWLTNLKPSDVLAHAHRFYDFMREAGVSPDSFTRELAFTKASDALGIDYETFYQAWLNEMPIGPAVKRRAKRS